MFKGLKKGGTFLLNSIWDAEETKNRLPDHMKKYLPKTEISFYIINATRIAEESVLAIEPIHYTGCLLQISGVILTNLHSRK